MVHLSFARYASIGFVGLGNMGKHMATNLIAAKHQVTIFDVNPQALDHFKEQKTAKVVSVPQKAVENAEFVVLMLPNGKIVRDVCQSSIFPTAKKGTYIVDCSTIDVRTSKDMAELSQSKQLRFVDAPVSGGTTGAQKGTLTFMVGAQPNDFKAVEPILGQMGKNIIHVGPNGSGLSAKICNNLLLAISMIGTAEAMSLGVKLGLDTNVLAKLINSSSGQCWSSQTYNPCPGVVANVPSSNDYNGGFASEMMTKDLLLALDAAKEINASTPLTEKATELYREICSKGLNKKDFSVVYKYLIKE
jgi:3-hydroxyisobutyrate dehydrogenase